MDCAGIMIFVDDNWRKITYTFYMKIMVTGATGLLGRAVYKQLEGNENFNVIGTGFSRAQPPVEKLNLRSMADVDSFLDNYKPECIVHCAAERRPDISEADPDASRELNVEVTGHLAEQSAERGIFMLYISTDYVFDGRNPPYYPDSKTNPLNFYGRTKLAGEEAVKSALESYIILRVPILYGTETYPRESSVSSVAASLMENRGGTFDDVAARYPTHTEDVAGVINSILNYRADGGELSGIFHFSGDESFTKYQMALVMADMLGIERECISPDRKGQRGADRPVNSRLDSGKLAGEISLRNTPFNAGIKPVLERLFRN